jgi:hypothetical protein
MNASRLLQSLFRIPRGLWSALVAPVPIRRPVERARPRSAAPVKREFQPTSFQAARPEIEPVALRAAAAAPAPVVVKAAPVIVAPAVEAEAPAGAKTMRSLEEVRADLARLRETARERHALTQQQARHVDTSPRRARRSTRPSRPRPSRASPIPCLCPRPRRARRWSIRGSSPRPSRTSRTSIRFRCWPGRAFPYRTSSISATRSVDSRASSSSVPVTTNPAFR